MLRFREPKFAPKPVVLHTQNKVTWDTTGYRREEIYRSKTTSAFKQVILSWLLVKTSARTVYLPWTQSERHLAVH